MNNEMIQQGLIAEKVLFVDGLTRAGKFLLAKIISGCKGSEYFQYQCLLEHIPVMESLGVLKQNDAISLFQTHLNLFVYERIIGRNINTRQESSGIYNALDYAEYFDRGKRRDGQLAVNKFLAQKRVPVFLVHECLPFIGFFERAVPGFMMAHIRRHPMDIIFSWYKRGWGARWGNDKLSFSPAIKVGGEGVPWFALGWADEWVELKNRPLDRVIKSIVSLYELEDVAYFGFSEKERVCKISYEKLFEEPEVVMRKIVTFVGGELVGDYKRILKRELVGSHQGVAKRDNAEREIKRTASREYYRLAVDASQEYEELWGIRSQSDAY